ncbi:MAG: polyprenyl synthetase family protein [Paludibacteraceae bacterium]|nr:polyprenyl synthetase family protein [Paludibacteraceae bacterium]
MSFSTDIRHLLQDDFLAFERLYNETLRSDSVLLGEALEYVRSHTGKQLRPQLVLLAAKICHGVTDKTLRTALAMELLHTASLIHDDVVDDSPMRRGMESLQVRWTNKVAVLVGDYLLSLVMQAIASLRNTRILSIVSDLSAMLASGELLQIDASSSMWITEERYNDIISRKTAGLFAACMEAGAESSGATMKQTTALRQFGWYLGMCFQLKDDVLDYSDSEELGKPTMNDIRDGKATLPLLVAVSRAPKQEADSMRELAQSMASSQPIMPLSEAEQTIKSFIMRYDGVRYAYQQMHKHKEKAEQCLNIFRDSNYKSALIQMLDYSINRVY